VNFWERKFKTNEILRKYLFDAKIMTTWCYN